MESGKSGWGDAREDSGRGDARDRDDSLHTGRRGDAREDSLYSESLWCCELAESEDSCLVSEEKVLLERRWSVHPSCPVNLVHQGL